MTQQLVHQSITQLANISAIMISPFKLENYITILTNISLQTQIFLHCLNKVLLLPFWFNTNIFQVCLENRHSHLLQLYVKIQQPMYVTQ